MNPPPLTSSPPASTPQYTHKSICQSISTYFHQHPANPPPPAPPTPHQPTMPVPTFSCNHQFLPIPPHTPYPPPARLPFPCRACHFTTTQAADARTRARYDPAVRELDRQIALAEEKMWYEYEERLAKRLELVRGQRRELRGRMEYEVRECWRGFDARWGGPMR